DWSVVKGVTIVPFRDHVFDNPEFKDVALLELAKINSKSKDPKLKKAAADSFRRVREDYQNPQLREDATLGLGRLYHEDGKWAEANAEWKTYMGSKTYNKARTEVAFKMAETYEKMNQVDNAVKAYFNVYALHAPKLDYSGEAVLRLTDIQWKRGKKAEAFKILTEAYVRMRKNDHPKVQALKVKSAEWKAALKQSGDLTAELEELSNQAG
ncbi:MAG: tetratricopeptide repeat protein, partial [Verrucomicrobiota bacterium]